MSLSESMKGNQNGVRSGNVELIRSYIREGKDLMPDGKKMPVLKLARIIYEDHPLKFGDVERVRVMIGKVIGRGGKGNQLTKEFFEYGVRPKNPYNLPDSDETVYEPFIIKGKRILGLFDVHVPYYSVPALTAAITYGKKLKPDTILLGGDCIDFYQGSDYVKDKTKKQIVDELNMFAEFIAVLRKEFPKARIVFKEGNHEERYNTFLYKKAGELQGIPEFSLEAIIRKRAGDIDYVGKKRIIKAGDLNIIHGHEFKGGISTPVNIARGLFLKAKVSCMQGHNHATSEHTETDMNGKITTTWSVGCLSELHPDYMPLNKWNHGFAFIEVLDDDSFQVHNKRIHKGDVL